MNYPQETGHVAHSETSRDSARALDESGRAGTYDATILQRLKELGIHGATAEEMRIYLNRWHPHVHNGSVNGRMSTLWRRREIVKTTTKRKTKANKDAHVYVHDCYRFRVQAEAEYVEAVGDDPAATRELAQMLFDGLQFTQDGGGRLVLAPLDLAVAENLARRAGLKK